MDTPHHHHHHRRHRITLLLASMTTLAILLLASLDSSFPSRQLSLGVRKMKEDMVDRVFTRRRLAGPGSAPPTCRSKCGRCYPCKPVHVPIQPGFSMKLEYYPEAWRCKCRNRLFMP